MPLVAVALGVLLAPGLALAQPVQPPTLVESFGASLIGLDGTTTLSFTITDPAANADTLTGVGFTDTLPAGLLVSSPNGLSGSCGAGAIVANAATSSVSLSGGSLAPGSSCTFQVNVTAVQVGAQTNTTSAVTSNEAGAGNTASAVLTVIGPPTITLASPAGGVTYAFGQKVRADYSCADDPNGPGVSSCTGTVPNGALIDTSQPGPQRFTVTAVSKDGGIGSDTVFYTVAPNNHVRVKQIRTALGGVIRFHVEVPGPGRVDVLEAAADAKPGHAAGVRRPARGHFTFSRAHRVATRAKTIAFVIKPDGLGRLALSRRHQLRVVVWVTYTPRGGTAHTTSFAVNVSS